MYTHTPEPDQTPGGPAYEGRLLVRPDDEVVDQGAGFDLATLITRRRVLGVAGLGVGALALAACSSSGATTSTSGSTTSSTSASNAVSSTTADGEIPEETNGPYPADGTNGSLNVLTESGIVRSDITSSLDGGMTVAGTPLEFSFTLTDMANDGAAFEGAAVYVWHADGQGRYSMYSDGVTDETFLRGIQVADSDGKVTFTTIVPGCYDGRWTHIHFEVYPDLASATNVENTIATSQVAFPVKMVNKVYKDTDLYPSSAANLAKIGSIDNDGVFGDGYDLEMGTFKGNPEKGYVGSLPVAIDTTTTPAAGGLSPSGGGPGDGGAPPSGPPSDAATTS
ncbi:MULTISPECIES: 3,4-dioxygenase subunit beta [Nocardioides]|uniref:3,4-dioxygenase subunit beta n=1 Tax=Nocardioides vastitatis TaxID=2568655 RepID=A0ABW0ZHB7_9ACTN|nr:3,4-dioxygenase subunit beta [Nocardioides sp.]THI94080.1 3,4-dioxygenase subunit beta [Nocardioides sp.]